MSNWNDPGRDPYRDADPYAGPPPPPGRAFPPPGSAYQGPDPYGRPPQGNPYGNSYGYPGVERKSRMAAGLLGIFIGGFGVHSFYLGDTKKGVIQILVTIFTCGFGALWGFIEGIMILAGSINTDVNGVPLDK